MGIGWGGELFLESQVGEYEHYLVNDESVEEVECDDEICHLGKINFMVLGRKRLDLGRG